MQIFGQPLMASKCYSGSSLERIGTGIDTVQLIATTLKSCLSYPPFDIQGASRFDAQPTLLHPAQGCILLGDGLWKLYSRYCIFLQVKNFNIFPFERSLK